MTLVPGKATARWAHGAPCGHSPECGCEHGADCCERCPLEACILDAFDMNLKSARTYVAFHTKLARKRPPTTARDKLRLAVQIAKCARAKRTALHTAARRLAVSAVVQAQPPFEARLCPRGHGRLHRENRDYYCLACGHREPEGRYFVEETTSIDDVVYELDADSGIVLSG